MEIRQVFPQRLRELRESMGLTMEEFAAKVKIPRSSMALYEGGQRVPNIVVFGRICGEAKCEPDYLLGFVRSVKAEQRKVKKEPVDYTAGMCGMFKGDISVDEFLERKHRDKELYES